MGNKVKVVDPFMVTTTISVEGEGWLTYNPIVHGKIEKGAAITVWRNEYSQGRPPRRVTFTGTLKGYQGDKLIVEVDSCKDV